MRSSELVLKTFASAFGALACVILILDPPYDQVNPLTFSHIQSQMGGDRQASLPFHLSHADRSTHGLEFDASLRPAAHGARVLRGGNFEGESFGGAFDGVGDIGLAETPPSRHASLWLFLGLAIFWQSSYVGHQALIPYRHLGVLRLTVPLNPPLPSLPWALLLPPHSPCIIPIPHLSPRQRNTPVDPPRMNRHPSSIAFSAQLPSRLNCHPS